MVGLEEVCASRARRGPPRHTEAHSPGAPSMRMPYQMRPGRRVVISWTSHQVPCGEVGQLRTGAPDQGQCQVEVA
jgi:hypothetical protein